MTDEKATPEQWADAGAFASGTRACILELRARVKALEDDAMEQARSQEFCLDYIIQRLEKLEAAQQKIRSSPESPLVERVADAIAAQATSAGIVNDRPARAAILEVAAWLRTSTDLDHGPTAARFLVEEANPTSQED
jgi:hypothetical protein